MSKRLIKELHRLSDNDGSTDLIALCDDGTLWRLMRVSDCPEYWRQLPDVEFFDEEKYWKERLRAQAEDEKGFWS